MGFKDCDQKHFTSIRDNGQHRSEVCICRATSSVDVCYIHQSRISPTLLHLENKSWLQVIRSNLLRLLCWRAHCTKRCAWVPHPVCWSESSHPSKFILQSQNNLHTSTNCCINWLIYITHTCVSPPPCPSQYHSWDYTAQSSRHSLHIPPQIISKRQQPVTSPTWPVSYNLHVT